MEITTDIDTTDGHTRYMVNADEIELRYLLAGLSALNGDVTVAFNVPFMDGDSEIVFDAAEEIVLALGFAGAVP